MEPELRTPSSPGLPLFPLSSERANARKRGAPDSETADMMFQQLSPSPSLSSLPHLLHQGKGHMRGSSDVQGKVAQFNGLAKEAAQRRKDSEAALRRAVLGREEAENECRRLREANDQLRKEIEEGRGSERKASSQMETLKHEVQKQKDAQARERTIFEKEVRRSRKEAFKSSSALVACQEELRGVRNRSTLMRENMEDQKRLVSEEKERELVHIRQQLGDEIDDLKARLQIAEQEKTSLKMTLDQDSVLRAASEGSIALPTLKEEDEFASPRKRRRADRESLKENLDPQGQSQADDLDNELMALKEDLRMEQRLRQQAQDEAQFLKMECQFGVCSCRMAEKKSERFIHDHEFAPKSGAKATVQNESTASLPHHTSMPDQDMPIDPAIVASPEEPENTATERAPSREILFSPNSGTFTKTSTVPIPEEISPLPAASSSRPSTPEKPTLPQAVPATAHAHSRHNLPTQTPRPLPNPPAPQTVSHFATTSIPLRGDNPLFSPAPDTPGGISREEALERIRQRRGRARSFAVGIGGTPGRRSVREKENGGEARVISAPVKSVR